MIEQRSEAWFQVRAGKITASNVGAILGVNPYRTREDVMRAMVREVHGAESEFVTNQAIQWGVYNEDGALIDFSFKTGLEVQKAGFIPYEDWAGCSPDGLIGDDSGVEAKCPFSLRTAHCPVPFKSLAEQPHYEAQVQFSMFVTQRKTWNFFQWAPNETRNELVEFSQEWADTNVPRLRQFYAEFLHEAEHNFEEHLAPRRPSLDTPEAHGMVAEWDALTERLAALTERKKDLLDSMVSLAGGKDTLFAGRKLTCVEREGAVSYARVVKDHLPDLDLSEYKGKTSRFWRLS